MTGCGWPSSAAGSAGWRRGRARGGRGVRGAGVAASSQGGPTTTADVVVGADGIHSAVRACYHRDQPVFSGTIAYRGLIPLERLPSLDREGQQLTFWLGPRQHFLTFPVASGTLLNLVAFVPADGTWAEESWTAPGSVDALAEQFEGWVA